MTTGFLPTADEWEAAQRRIKALETERDAMMTKVYIYNQERDKALEQVRQMATRAERAEAALVDANKDAESLASELMLEQNPGYFCEALRAHAERLCSL